MKNKLLLLVLCVSAFSFGQIIPEDVKPPSWKQPNEFTSSSKPFKLQSFDLKSIQDEDLINDKDKSKPWRFGHELYVDHNFNEVGKWTTLPNGDKVWRMSYTSEGALSLNFFFDVFRIPEGAKLYVYNNEKTDIIRPFTYHNNNPEEVLGTWLVEGDRAWIEYHQPANIKGQAKLTVGSVIHGYRTAETYQKALNDSGACNHDVDCDITPPGTDSYNIDTVKESVKKASGMLVTGNTGFCSGTLVNNTSNDGTPYFMTANHCGFSTSWAFRFNWRSPNPSCGTFTNSTNGPFNQTVSGAVLRANSSQSDMALVEITDPTFFNNNPDVVWAGWNNSTTQTPNLNFGIHHPSGDIQKVCRDDQGGTRTQTNFNGNPTTQVWRIADWDLGVTEPGSSGSGLFNENGELIGVLSGGSAACSGTNDNGGFDIYGRFGVAWDFGSSASSRLRDWLDPGNTGATEVGIYPPLETYDIDARVSAGSDNEAILCSEDFSPDVTLINPGNLNLISADVTYHLDSEPETTINWTGNLATDASQVIANPTYPGLAPGGHSFTVQVTNPNSTVDENTSNNTFVFAFEVSPEYSTNDIILDITTDNYASETTWEVRNSLGVLISNGGAAYANATTYQETISIPAFDECYTFTILDSYGDGICCGFGSGSYSLEDGDGNVIIAGGDFGASESVLFKTLDPLSIDDNSLADYVSIYPNPVEDELNIRTQNISEVLDYEVVNALGQSVKLGELPVNTVNRISLSELSTGIYFIKLSTETSSFVQKIIKE